MWGRTCFALYVALQQVSRYTTYQIPIFIVFRDVPCVVAMLDCPDLSFFPILFCGSRVAVNLLGGPSGLHWCGFRDARGARGFRENPKCSERGAKANYCVAAKPHRQWRGSARRGAGYRRKIDRGRRFGGGPLERRQGGAMNPFLPSLACAASLYIEGLILAGQS